MYLYLWPNFRITNASLLIKNGFVDWTIDSIKTLWIRKLQNIYFFDFFIALFCHLHYYPFSPSFLFLYALNLYNVQLLHLKENNENKKSFRFVFKTKLHVQYLFIFYIWVRRRIALLIRSRESTRKNDSFTISGKEVTRFRHPEPWLL